MVSWSTCHSFCFIAFAALLGDDRGSVTGDLLLTVQVQTKF